MPHCSKDSIAFCSRLLSFGRSIARVSGWYEQVRMLDQLQTLLGDMDSHHGSILKLLRKLAVFNTNNAVSKLTRCQFVDYLHIQNWANKTLWSFGMFILGMLFVFSYSARYHRATSLPELAS